MASGDVSRRGRDLGAKLDYALASRFSHRAWFLRRTGLQAAGCGLLILLASACATVLSVQR
jgi:hypothetical protein